MLTKLEIIDIMKKPKSASLANKYREIWLIATGRSFGGCLCGDGFSRLYNLCKNYATQIEKGEDSLKTI